MDIKQRHTPETIVAYPINMERLNQSINQTFHKDGMSSPKIEYGTHGIFALIREPSLCLIDDEFVGWDIKEKITFHIYETETREDRMKIHTCLPTHEVTLTIAELEKYLMPPISLAEFTRNRRGYNSRIKANEADWMRYFNK